MTSRFRLRPAGWHPPRDSLRHRQTFRQVAETVEHHPNVRLALLDPSVADRLAMVGFLASRHKNELQRHSMGFLKYGMRADLNSGPYVEFGCVQRDALI
jgi:hypothetical protein